MTSQDTYKCTSILEDEKPLTSCSSITLFVSNLDESPDICIAIAPNKSKLIESSSLFSAVFAFMESYTLRIKVPCPRNFIECILPVLEDSTADPEIDEANCIEILRNARHLGLPNIYRSAIEVFVANHDAILGMDAFNPENILCSDMHIILKTMHTKSQSYNSEQILISRLNVLFSWVRGYEKKDVEIIGLIDNYTDFSRCEYNGDLCNGLIMLRKKFPIVFYDYVSFESILDLIERSKHNNSQQIEHVKVPE